MKTNGNLIDTDTDSKLAAEEETTCKNEVLYIN